CDRPLVAMDAIGFYLWKIFWPLKLGVDYGRTPQSVIASHSILWTLPLLVAAVALVCWTRGIRCLAIGLIIFILALLPVLGLIPFEFQAYSTVADRYVYLGMLGPAIVVVRILSKARSSWIWSAAFLLCCIAAALSFRQARTWHDGMSISNQALLANPRSWASHGYIAALDVEANQPREAIEHAQLAVEMNPQYGKAFDTLGQAYARLNLRGHAAAAYRRAIAISPSDLSARMGLANVFVDAGDFPNAIEQYGAALRIDPANVIALSNLAAIYGEMGQLDRSIQLYDAALSLSPGFPPAQVGRQHAIDLKSSTTRP
ncbi:MAG TPA: tetratricopeptide repeat protein, partial [Tepidisphaeraceae bacterium]